MLAPLVVALLSGNAYAYATDVHALITREALVGLDLDGAADPIDPTLPAEIRAEIDARARIGPHAAEWIARYPTPDAFDAWSEKEFLLFSPAATVQGIDAVGTDAATLRLVMATASKQPDDDLRNMDRFAYGADRKPIVDALGAKVPADPALLNMGTLGQLSSQAHAHYGLARGIEFSDDADVLKTDPRRFAVASGYPKGPILTIAPEMAQIHLDLALIAALSDRSGARTLAWEHTGQAFHYLEDVTNTIHTVQVGLYDFFVDAYKDRLGMGLATGGGYVGKMRSLPSIGIDILTSHHTISEEFTRKRALDADAGDGIPEAEALVAAIREDDADFAAKLDAATAALGDHPERAEFGEALTLATIDVSSYDGADLYRATRGIALAKWRKQGVVYDWEHDDPLAAVQVPDDKNAAAYADFWRIQTTQFRRAGTVTRRWIALEKAVIAAADADPAAKDAIRTEVIDRLVERQLAMLTDAEARRADYLANPPDSVTKKEHAPGILITESALVLGIAAVIVVLAL
jgi:hypothetical protein